MAGERLLLPPGSAIPLSWYRSFRPEEELLFLLLFLRDLDFSLEDWDVEWKLEVIGAREGRLDQ